MSSEHTKEPWRVAQGYIASAANVILPHDNWEANARRIVACVNCLEGISTAEVERMTEAGHFATVASIETERDLLRSQLEASRAQALADRAFQTKNVTLWSQNAELVEALNELLYGTDCYLDTESRSVFHFTTEQLAQARSALAKAKP